MSRKFLIWFSLLSIWSYAGDSTRYYHWMREDLAFIQFYDSASISTLIKNWKKNPSYVVAHFGDSHVQPDIISSELRRFLHSELGYGGRGMVFPYASARTHSGFDYWTRSIGSWQYSKITDTRPKLPLGLSGVSIRTTSVSSGFNFSFREEPSSSNSKLLIYCLRSDKSYDLTITTDKEKLDVDVFDQSPEKGPLEIVLTQPFSKLNIQVRKSTEEQVEFELYGISIEAPDGSGARVHSLGISGAPYNSLLQEALLEEQLQQMKPDMVILDLGTNDYIPGNRIPVDMEIQITDVIKKIRRAIPESNILLTTTQDMNRRGINMSAGRSFSQLIKEIARKEHCAFFDWYWISGGPKTMHYWVNYGLAQRDNIHLTRAGYVLKGKFLAKAFQNTLEKLATQPNLNSLILHEDSIPLPLQAKRDSLRKIPESPKTYLRTTNNEIPSGKLITHVIRNGETLGSIAEKYGVSVTSIRELNGIYGSKIIAGKSLKVVVKNNYPTQPLSTKIEGKQSTISTKNKTIQHKIASGETLTSIAEKYKVSVEEIKKINGLSNSRIVAGKTLVIPVNTEDLRNKS